MEHHVILCMIPTIIFCLHKDWFFNSNTTFSKAITTQKILCDICICELIFIYIYEHIVIKFATGANYCHSLKKYQFKLEIICMHFNWRIQMSMSSELNEYIIAVYIFEKQLSLFLFFLVSFCALFIMRRIFYILATSPLQHWNTNIVWAVTWTENVILTTYSKKRQVCPRMPSNSWLVIISQSSSRSLVDPAI